MQMTFIVTGGRSPVALDLSRQLHASGQKVISFESMTPCLLSESIACFKHVHAPSPRHQTRQYIDELKKVIQKNKVHTLIPTCEEVFYISKYKEELEATGVTVLCPSFQQIIPLHSKWQFNQLVKKDFLAPETSLHQSKKSLEELLKNYINTEPNKKFVLKREFSRFSMNVLIDTAANLLKKIDALEIDSSKAWLLQHFVSGSEYCTYSVAQNGKLLAHSTYSHEFTAGAGAGISFEYVEYPELVNWIKAFCQKNNITGQLAFDFIIDAKGQIYPLECNPRASSGMHLLCLNPNFAEIFSSKNKELAIVLPPTNAQAALKLAMFIYGTAQMITSVKKLKAFFRVILSAQEVVWKKEDSKPFLVQFKVFFNLVRKAVFLKTNALGASTFDIEYNHENLELAD